MEQAWTWTALRIRSVAFCFYLLSGIGVIVEADAQLIDRLLNRKDKKPVVQSDPGVPQPISGQVNGKKGHEISFEISADAKTPGSIVEFLVRDFPIAGRIVSLVSKEGERNKAIVTYYADPSSAATTDAFSFAVRYRGGRYSSAARFDINLDGTRKTVDGMVLARGSKLEVTQAVDFGKVHVGSEVVKDVYIKNKGDVEYQSQILLYSPWHVVKPERGQLKLPPGTSAALQVAFRPKLTGPASHMLALNRSKEGLCKLSAEAVDPFTFSATEVELKTDPKTNQRKGEVDVLYHGGKPMIAKLLASVRLQRGLGKEIVLMPGKATTLSVYLPESDVSAFEGSVELALENGFGKSVSFFSKVVPPRLEIEIPNSVNNEILNFGQVQAGGQGEKSIILKNTGGTMAPLDFEIPPPFQLLGRPVEQLASGASVPVAIGLYPRPDAIGAADQVMTIFANDKSVTLRLMGNVIKSKVTGFRMSSNSARLSPSQIGASSSASAAAPASKGGIGNVSPTTQVNRIGPASLPTQAAVNTPANPTTMPGIAGPNSNSLVLNDAQHSTGAAASASRPRGKVVPFWATGMTDEELAKHRSPMGFITRTLIQRNVDETLKGAEDIEVAKQGAWNLTLSWTAPRDPELYTYEVETRSLVAFKDSPMPENAWMPIKSVEYDRIDRLVKAKIENLHPNSVYEFRVITLDNNEKAALPSAAIIAETVLPMDWTWIYVGFAFVMLVGLGLLARYVLRERFG